MKIDTVQFKVGKRGLEDRVLTEISGTVIQPDSRSENTLFVQAGHDGRHEWYVEHFGKKLGNDFNVVITELRKRGLPSPLYNLRNLDVAGSLYGLWSHLSGYTNRSGSGSRDESDSWNHFKRHSPDDFYGIYEQASDMLESGKSAALGHCSGANVVAETVKKHDVYFEGGLYCVSSYPSVRDRFTADANHDNKSLMQRLVDALPPDIFFGLSDFPMKEADIGENAIRFAIGGNDLFLGTSNSGRAARFETIFKNQFENCTVKLFPGKSHSFNSNQNYKAFNKGDPDVLVNDVRTFMYDNFSK